MRGYLPIAAICLIFASATAKAQAPDQDGETRAGLIAEQQQEKSKALQPYQPNKAERWVKQAEQLLNGGVSGWHPFFDSAYRGGGFTIGAGYLKHVSDYNWVDMRGSITPSGYIRTEAEFKAPRLFDRRGEVSVVGGWRRATQVGFYGFGTDTSDDSQALYGFTQPYLSSTLVMRPARHWLVLDGGAEYSKWMPEPRTGRGRLLEEVFLPELIPGYGAEPTYLQLFAGLAADTRPASGYTRRGGYYAVSWHQFDEPDDRYGFRRLDYEAIQHVPIGRDAWVLTLRGKVETTYTRDDQVVPYFMMPALGGGSDLRGFSSWRFRDLHSLLLQAEWRVLVNAFFDTAIFYDAGKVTRYRSDLDFTGLRSDYGIGFRIHGLVSTPLRIDVAHSNEGLHFIFSTSAVF
jgi:hypothetical protein